MLFRSAAAAASVGAGLKRLKDAKKKGCPAFHGSGRVDLDLLKKWLESNPERTATDLFPVSENEEALKLQADRQRSQIKAIQAAGLVVPKDQPLKVFAVVAKLFTTRLYALEERLAMLFKIPKDEIRRELDAVMEPLNEDQFKKLLSEAENSNE